MDHVSQVSRFECKLAPDSISSSYLIILRVVGSYLWAQANERASRRHADRTVQLWMSRLKESTSAKRLSLIYLANGKLALPGAPPLHACMPCSRAFSFRGDAAIQGEA